jgi:hypothetical protein
MINILVICTSFGLAQTPPENAALAYWQAFGTMPEQAKLSENEVALLHGWSSCAVDESVENLLRKFGDAFFHLRRAAAISYCDWQLVAGMKEYGLGLLIPHPDKARALSEASLLQVRYLIRKNKTTEAVCMLAATLAMARKVGASGPLSPILAGWVIESSAIGLIAASMSDIKHGGALPELEGALKRLPPPLLLSESLRTFEKNLYVDHIRTKGTAAIEGYFSEFDDASPMRKAEMRDRLGLNRQNIPRFCAELEKIFAQKAVIAELSVAECEKAEQALSDDLDRQLKTAEIRGPILLAARVLPSIARFRASEMRIDAKRRMVNVAILVTLRGQDHLKDVLDPETNQSFKYKKTADGFELTSQVQDKDGKPTQILFISREKPGGK